MKKAILNTFTLLLVGASMFWLSSCQKETVTDETALEQESTDRNNGNSKVFPISAHPYGQTYAKWSEVWLQKFFTYGCDDVPFVNPESVLFHTAGPVYMMAGIAEVGGEADVTIPRGKAVMIPLVNVWWNLCPGEVVPPDMTEGEYLTASMESILNEVDESSLSVTIDGAPVSNMPTYKVISDVFAFAGNAELVCFDPCVSGEVQNWVMGGYYVILKPMSPGQHTVHYTSAIPFYGAEQDATFNITVE